MSGGLGALTRNNKKPIIRILNINDQVPMSGGLGTRTCDK